MKKIKKGTRVRDCWYGAGVITKVTPRRIHIRIASKAAIWEYDMTHFKNYITVL